MTQRWKITVEYDGTDFVGWQKQKNGLAVQECIERAIKEFSGEAVETTVSGRTDAGVHAAGQVAHFDLEKDVDSKTVCDAINHYMRPKPISILQAEKVHAEFNARFDAKNRVYCYKIVMARSAPPVLDSRFAWHVWQELDVAAMNAAAKHLIGAHDYSSFRDSECQAKSPLRSVDRLEFIENKSHVSTGRHIELWAEARSFLHHQIRNFTGTLKMVGEGKLQPDDVKTILEARDRSKAGVTAPPNGLHFVRVDY